MRLSFDWLKDWIALPVDVGIPELAERLTLAGLEVEGSAPLVANEGEELRGVTVARIHEVLPHPNADRLKICVVDTGAAVVRVVCGAPNVVAGGAYAYAGPGAMLPGMEIAERKVRGERSVGMLCSADELGLGDHYGADLLRLGDDAVLGAPLYDWLKLDDTILSIDVTPNRGDCLSVYGLACEVAGLYDLPFPKISRPRVKRVCPMRVAVNLSVPEDCSCYVARVVDGVDATVPTPLWISERLRRYGMRPVNIVVDVCNYVMLDIGQPMHAFDWKSVDGAVEVRRARAKERLRLLDGTEAKLDECDLVIADSKKVMALAGVMGGKSSAVSHKTRTVLLESARFNPGVLVGRARSHNVQSEAAYRFERGVDPELAELAMQRCTALLVELASAKPGPVCRFKPGVVQRMRARASTAVARFKLHWFSRDIPRISWIGRLFLHGASIVAQLTMRKIRVKEIPVPRKWDAVSRICVRHSHVKGLLGLDLSPGRVRRLLRRVGARVFAIPRGCIVVPPSRRRDLSTEVDMLEEIARLHGYDRLPAERMRSAFSFRKMPRELVGRELIADRLVGLGYQEVINYSLVGREEQHHRSPPPLLSNWVSQDMSALRTSLLPGLLDNMYAHQCRQIYDLRLFEIGNCFARRSSNGGDIAPSEHVRLAMLLSGRFSPESWAGDGRPSDFYDLKADVLALLSISGRDFDMSQRMSGESCYLLDANCCVALPELGGMMGALDARWVKRWDLKGVPMLMELDLCRIPLASLDYVNYPASQPALSRDLSIVVSKSVPEEEIRNCIADTAARALAITADDEDSPRAELDSLLLFDVYHGSKIGASNKAVAYHLSFRHPQRALMDREADEVCREVLDALGGQFSAQLRQV